MKFWKKQMSEKKDKEIASKGQWHGGKGSVQKPKDHDKFSDGWDRIFGNKEKDKK